MGCSCTCENDYYCPGIRSGIQRARKRHKCCECGGTILAKQQYEYATGFYEDGTFWVAKTCLTCFRIRRDFCYGSWVYGGLREALWECLGLDYITGEIADWAKEDGDGET